MRYFRLSQLADDIFDAYRNAFLALEAALDATISLSGPKRESEWLRTALDDVLPRFGLDPRRYLLQAPGPDPAQQFMDEQYLALRCTVFHAKQGHRTSLLPGVAGDRRRVAEALDPLIRLVLDISRHAFTAIFPAGLMTVSHFETHMRTIAFLGYELSLLNTDQSGEDLSLDQIRTMATQVLRPADVGTLGSAGEVHGFLAEVPVAHVTHPRFNAIAAYTVHPFPGPPSTILSGHALSHHHVSVIDLAGIDILQVIVRWMLDNQRMPRSHFSL